MHERRILSRRALLKTIAAAGALTAAELEWWEEPLLRPRRAWGAGDDHRGVDSGRLRARPLPLRGAADVPARIPATQMFPAVLLIAPLLSQWHALGLIDTYQALIYSNFSFTVPFTVWMLVGYFESIPRELEESAMLDGCNNFGALCRIILPPAAPGVAATVIFAFVASWSELLFAITFTSRTEMRTLSAGLLFMVGQYEIQWGQLSAGVIISTIPVAILSTYLQRHLIQGLSAGAVKG
jgi:multiple sugar transport system permease protein